MSSRLNININDETNVAIRDLMARRGTTATELVRRAVSVYVFFEAARDRGDRIQIHNPDAGTTSEVIFR